MSDEMMFPGELSDTEILNPEIEPELNDEFLAPTDREDQEIQLAAELLSVTDDKELDQFISSFWSKVGRAAGGILNSPAGRQLKSFLRQTAKKALPLAGQAIGSYFGGSAGGDMGGKIASQAGQIFGLEVEGLSGEDQELQVARRYVQFASDALRRLTNDPQQGARQAVIGAARRYAPGLLANAPAKVTPAPGRRTNGRWYRRGNTIVIVGA